MFRASRRSLSRLAFLAGMIGVWILLDIGFAGWLIWQIPNESEWGLNPYYNFEYRARQLENLPVLPNRKRVLITGSSVAIYSISESLLENYLSDGSQKYEVRMLAHEGLSSYELAAYSDRIFAARPDYIILPVATVDFRLDRRFVIANPSDSAFIQDRLNDSGMKIVAPVGTLKTYSQNLTFSQKLNLIFSLSYSVRYRSFLFDPLIRRYQNRTGSGKSYQHYSGIDSLDHGISIRGYTNLRFILPVTETLLQEGLFLERLHPKSDSIQLASIQNQTCSLSKSLKSGWQRIFLPDCFRDSNKILVQIENGVYFPNRDATYGVRLAKNTGRSETPVFSYERSMTSEDVLYRSFSNKRYEISYNQRVIDPARPETIYFRAIDQLKSELAFEDFNRENPSFQSFQYFIAEAHRHQVPVIIFFTPENPISFQKYGKSEWFKGFEKFLDEQARQTGGSFYSTCCLFESQDFYDMHHMSFPASRKYSEHVAEILESQHFK